MQNPKPATFGRYQVLSELGRGAMGVVYKGYDPKINRPVAIKTISLGQADVSQMQMYRERFVCEAEAAGRLAHPRIVAIFDVGEDSDCSDPYIVMEYVQGRSLESLLASERTVPLLTSLRLVQNVAEALDYAHLQGVVHRDIKPSNILITADGDAKVADFGIAQLGTPNSVHHRRIWGTPAYMSPEQIKGGLVDGRSDLFSLGVVLYRMLAGHRPFQGNTEMTVSIRVTNQEAIPVTVFDTDLPHELDRVIARAIAKNPDKRYQVGMEMVLDLQRVRDALELSDQVMGENPRDSGATNPVAPGTSRGAILKQIFFSAQNRTATSTRNAAPHKYTGPWQQLGIASLTFACLTVSFVGLWKAIPIRTSTPSKKVAGIVALASPSNSSPTIRELGAEKLPRRLTARIRSRKAVSQAIPNRSPAAIEHPNQNPSTDEQSIQNPASNEHPANESQFCQLGIAVEHHFSTADLSVWVDGEPTYSHSLRGTMTNRILLFKGVEGYLSDSLRIAPGTHEIRVRIVSADGAYDQSGSISGTFAAGGTQFLAIGLDKHNRGMRLRLEEFSKTQPSLTSISPVQPQNEKTQ